MLCILSREPFRILHPDQHQPCRRRVRAGSAAVTRRHDLPKAGGVQPPATDPDQRADDPAHHVAQKPVGSNVKEEDTTLSSPGRLLHRPHRRARRRLARHLTNKGREAPTTEQEIRGRLHRQHVQGVPDVPAPAPLPEVAPASVTNGVAIASTQGAATGVELGRHLGSPLDLDVVRQSRVRRAHQSGRRQAAHSPETHHLPARMHSRIGPSRRDHPRSLAQDRRERLL